MSLARITDSVKVRHGGLSESAIPRRGHTQEAKESVGPGTRYRTKFEM